ncbi:hypothetical protein DMA11_23195 [Marinilabiliaceae bacterium JC017]|nr:hypothetical protein DMA11_23195 [Marinilabiliaceae bacterium JC017]
MNKSILITAILFLTSLSGFSQFENARQDSIKLSGVILDKDSLSSLPYAAFDINKQKYLSTEEGQFSIWAKQGDVIKFSHLGFRDTYINVTDSLIMNNYLLGIFLTRDTVQLSEVIIIPRHRNLYAAAKYMPLKITPEQVYASQNLRQSTYQALTTQPKQMDAAQNQQLVLHEQTQKTVYKTQLRPDQMLGISTEDFVPVMLYLSPSKRKITNPKVTPMTHQEIDFLISLYKRQQGIDQ